MATVPEPRSQGKQRKDHRVTFDEFCVLVKDGEKADLLDGVIHMASPDNTDAGELFVWLLTLLEMFVEEKQLGKVYGSRIAFRLNDYSAPEPDIAFVANDRLTLKRRGYFAGGPDLAIELVSPESVERDYEDKARLYEQGGVREYWIIDEMKEKVTLNQLSKKGTFREVKPKKGIFHSDVLPGFWLDPDWLWSTPQPLKKDILQQILGSQP